MGLNRAKSPVSSPSENSMALSRTVRLTQFSVTMPPIAEFSGPKLILNRDGFKPNTPQQDDGTRMEPPPSEACAAGTRPAATAAAAPPDEPPGEQSRFQGLWQGPRRMLSVVGSSPNSDVFVLPTMTSPPSMAFCGIGSLAMAGVSTLKREPHVVRSPATLFRSLMR